MRLIISGDWQCSITNLDRLSLVVDQIVNELEKTSRITKTFFVHLGDMPEVRNPVDVRVLNFIIESTTRIRKACSGFYYVRGNHDSITVQDNSPSICELMRTLGALEVADDGWRVIEVPILKFRGKANACLYFVPYFRDPQRQREEFEGPLEHIRLRTKANMEDARLLFLHNTVTGCRETLTREGTGLSIVDIGAEKYDACFAGHIHLAQELPPNIYVVGSPMAMSWSEANYRHRIITVTIPEGGK
jgi:DNA repair exonuclease SbcCD nuclease subunit